tara:strand:- start:8914 stop:9303 length:390 start_codon:yes stop_codon:yes gene_type:complete
MSKDIEKDPLADLFTDENKPESNWFKFEKVGDKVAGEVVETYEQAGSGNFPGQRVFCLKQADGNVVNVGLKQTSNYLMTRTKNVKLGDILGVEFKAEIPAKVKGNHPAKSIEVYVKHMNKTEGDGFGGL